MSLPNPTGLTNFQFLFQCVEDLFVCFFGKGELGGKEKGEDSKGCNSELPLIPLCVFFGFNFVGTHNLMLLHFHFSFQNNEACGLSYFHEFRKLN